MKPERIFHPKDTPELLGGWLLHAHKERDRHDEAARRYENRRFTLGSIAIALSAIVGTSVFGSLATKSADARVAVAVGLVSVAATVLTALSTFFDYAGRATRHRKAAAACKGIIREIEEAISNLESGVAIDPAWVKAIRQRFDLIASDTPVVLPDVYRTIQEKYTAIKFIEEAKDLYPMG